MGAPLVPRGYNKKSQKYWDSQIINKPDVVKLEREAVPPRPVLFSEDEYDTLQPEENIKSFCSFVRQAISQYEQDKETLVDLENQMQDILHFAEMSKDKDTVSGYKIYKELCQIRRKRRQCKNEIDLLAPVYEMFHGTKMLDQLANLQGSCKQIKKSISGMAYTARTDILDSFIH